MTAISFMYKHFLCDKNKNVQVNIGKKEESISIILTSKVEEVA